MLVLAVLFVAGCIGLFQLHVAPADTYGFCSFSCDGDMCLFDDSGAGFSRFEAQMRAAAEPTRTLQSAEASLVPHSVAYYGRNQTDGIVHTMRASSATGPVNPTIYRRGEMQGLATSSKQAAPVASSHVAQNQTTMADGGAAPEEHKPLTLHFATLQNGKVRPYVQFQIAE